jgi:hypothetical protein
MKKIELGENIGVGWNYYLKSKTSVESVIMVEIPQS